MRVEAGISLEEDWKMCGVWKKTGISYHSTAASEVTRSFSGPDSTAPETWDKLAPVTISGRGGVLWSGGSWPS